MISKRSSIPKGSFLDNNGKRWTYVYMDVLTNNGTKFIRQIKVLLGIHFDFKMGAYTLDQELGQPLVDVVKTQYPSLSHLRNIQLHFTTNRILR